MKITCSIEIMNRYIRALNFKKKKATVATLALCRKPNSKKNEHGSDKDVFLIICTHSNPRGTKYKVYNNVDKLFTKYVNEGKATVRFKEPAHDIIISKADPLQLKNFLHGVGLTLVGQGCGKIRLSTPPTKVDRPKVHLSVLCRKDYPVRSGFPRNLTWLQIQNCKLKKIPKGILKLENLQVLDLANNAIKELPVGLGNMRIRELILAHNEITVFPDELSLGIMGQEMLHVLDLSFNMVPRLSPYFCLMKNLSVLQLKGNRLSSLPRNMHALISLRMFSASHNQLKVLPFGIRKLELDSLDLFHNPLNTDVVLKPVVPWEVPSLLESAAYALVSQNVRVSREDLPPVLHNYITDCCPCPCGKLVFQRESSCILVLDLYKLASTVVYINNSSRFKVPLQVFFCSNKCWRNERMFL